MVKYTKDIFLCLLAGFFITIVSCYIESTYILDFLRKDLFILLVTLLAINTATLGLLSTKIQDVYLNYKTADFTMTTNEMKKSLLEQLLLIIISIILLIFDSSKVIEFDLKDLITSTILIAVLIFDIYILWDTGNAVFVLLEEIRKLNHHEN